MSVILREATVEEAKILPPCQQGYWDQTKNTLGVLLDPDFVKAYSSVLDKEPDLPTWSCLMGTRHISIVTDKTAAREVLKHYRTDTEGLFTETRAFVLEMIKEFFFDEEITSDDFILTCNKEYSEKYRPFIINQLRKLPIETIQGLAESEINGWSGTVSLQRISSFVSAVLSSILGKSTPFEAIETFNNDVLRPTIMRQHPQAYEEALKTIRETIEETLKTSETAFVTELKNSDFTPTQQKALLFALFFAGQETTASALTYIIWDLARHPEKQEEIFNDIKEDTVSDAAKKFGNYGSIQKVIAMGLFNHPPVPAFGRVAKRDLVFQFGEEKKLIPKGQQINVCPLFIKEKEPKHVPTNYPFGNGRHRCPGETLARREMNLFLLTLIKQFRFTTKQDKVTQVCRLTMKLKEEIFIELEPRT